MAFAPSNVSINQLYYYWYYQLWINCLILFLSKQLFLFIWLLFQIYCWIRFPPFMYLVHTFYIFGDPCVIGVGRTTGGTWWFCTCWNTRTSAICNSSKFQNHQLQWLTMNCSVLWQNFETFFELETKLIWT